MYSAPVKDFSLSAISLETGASYSHTAVSPEILVVTSGSAKVANGETYRQGEALYVCPDTSYSLTADQQTTLFRAFVP